MLYALKMCVLTAMVFLTFFAGVFFAWIAIECGWSGWGIVQGTMSSMMFASSWLLFGSIRFIEKPEPQEWGFGEDTPHTKLGQGHYEKKYYK